MAYHTSIYLFLFLPAALLAYQLMPQKRRWMALLLAGYVFFWIISGALVLYLIGTTALTYGIGVWLGRLKLRSLACQEQAAAEERAQIKAAYKKKQRRVLAAGIAALLLVLGWLKYYNFFADNLNALTKALGGRAYLPLRKMMIPIGISFYTLQAIGYMADVYWERVKPGGHPGRVALFLGFFPQIMEGPISLYSQTADALWEGKPLCAEQLVDGCMRIFWGLFKKMIVADRLYVLVEAVFEHHTDYHGVMIAAAAVAYTVQLYMEFSGCMDIVIGSGRMFGVTLPENFCQPFVSKNAAEFWRRWHMTLGVWLKTYIFYPITVSGLVKKWSRFGRKRVGKHWTKVGVSAMALFPVWLCNGLWHGAKWSYLFYGMYYFVILLCGLMLEPVREKALRAWHIREDAAWFQGLRILKTWLIIFTGELFFRADSLRIGLEMFASMFRDFGLARLWDGTFLNMGLDVGDFLAIFCGCAVVAVVGSIKERKLLGGVGLQGLRLPVRWTVYYALILAVVIFGAYGAGYQQVDLIYAGF